MTKDDHAFVVDIGDWIKQYRLQMNISLEELGEVVGLSTSQLSRLERGISEVTLIPAVKLFRALGIDVLEFVEYVGLRETKMYFLARKQVINKKHHQYALRLIDAWCAAVLYRFMPSRKEFLRSLAGWYLQLAGMAMLPQKKSQDKDRPVLERAYDALHAIFERGSKEPLPYFEVLTTDEIAELYLSGSAMLVTDGSAYLRQWRVSNKLRLKEVASRAGISLGKYYDLERDRTHNLKLSTILQVQRVVHAEPVFPLFWAAASARAGIDDAAPFDPDPFPWDEETWLMAEALMKMARLAYSVSQTVAKEWLKFVRDRCTQALAYMEGRYGKAVVREIDERCFDLNQLGDQRDKGKVE